MELFEDSMSEIKTSHFKDRPWPGHFEAMSRPVTTVYLFIERKNTLELGK